MQSNQQPREKKQHSISGKLQVHHAWETIQGEGPFAGTPAVFFRLTGCNLQCPFCDTDYTSERQLLTVEQCLTKIRSIRFSGLVVLTGGEPMRQNVAPLCHELIRNGYQPQIETNGTIYVDGLPSMEVVCSPKVPKLDVGMCAVVTAWKYVVAADHVDPTDGLPTSTLGGPRPCRPTNSSQVYVQPMDEGNEERNKRHIDAAVASCLKYGYRLCLQTHKLIGLE